MKPSKTPQQLARNASKMHKHVGELLTCEESPYKNFDIRQEYSVSRVNAAHRSNREKYDWVILGLRVVIEVHGEQHYRPVCFGGMDIEEAKSNLRKQRMQDEVKEMASVAAGWAYVVIKYDESITGLILHGRITEAIEAILEYKQREEIKPARPKAKLQTKDKYEWPTKKIPSRPFPKK